MDKSKLGGKARQTRNVGIGAVRSCRHQLMMKGSAGDKKVDTRKTEREI
jgi:hypothetical protein